MLYQIFIYPIELIIETIYYLFVKIVGNPGLSIVGVSVAVQIITLPLYAVAEKWQGRERLIQNNLKDGIDRIKSSFKGDEQYMILSTFYRQNNYHPMYALRSTIGLLIQIPFFIAAFSFISQLESLKGQGFYFIPNLIAPDALFTIGSFSVNILPILMTLINILGSAIYTIGFSKKEKVQLYGMATLFLVLLYNAPSALVLYWTMNNVIALIKNIVSKYKNPLRIFYIIASTCAILAIMYAFIYMRVWPNRLILICAVSSIVLISPIFIICISKYILPQLQILSSQKKQRTILFFCSTVGLFLLSGVFIPSSLTSSDINEFLFIGNYTTPFDFLIFPVFHAAGIFLVWLPALYILFSESFKNIFTWFIVSFFAIVLLNTFILSGDYGFITAMLQFHEDLPLIPDVKTLAIDAIVIILCLCTSLLLIKTSRFRMLIPAYGLICISIFALGIFQYAQTNTSYFDAVAKVQGTTIASSESNTELHSVFSLSKNKQNVVLFLLDKAIAGYVPFIFEDAPYIKEQFAGFTWYPNALSLGPATILGAAPAYGGYDHQPGTNMNTEGEIQGNKTREAAAFIPNIFNANGYKTTIIDPPLFGSTGGDLRDYFVGDTVLSHIDPMPFRNKWLEENIDATASNTMLQDTLILFSLFRMSPSSIRGGLYMDGHWWRVSSSHNNPYFDTFLKNYAVLHYFDQVTPAEHTDKNTFTYMYNTTPHDRIDAKYLGKNTRESESSGKTYNWTDDPTQRYYNANFLTLTEMGRWFDYLREENLYDNTRIILVADHGTAVKLPQFDSFNSNKQYQEYIKDIPMRPEQFNILLMVKDFNSNATFAQDDSLMTNADVVHLATEDIIENPINPYTKKPITIDTKENGVTIYDIVKNIERYKLGYEVWNVKENIFDPQNWTKIEQGE